MKQIITLISLVLSLISVSCTAEKKTLPSPVRPDMSAFKGKKTDKLICRLDSNNSYALFLPSTYDSSFRWPVIIAFDSHGDGRLPVNLLAEQAEKYATIIIGSNNSKNGLSQEITSGIYDALLADIEWRFSIDKQRVYTMGFSGGARVAAYQAINKSGIRGVIGCSAGFPPNSISEGVSFQYFGVAGSDDFNLLEMKQLFKSLEGTSLPHYLLVFEGTHAWPPKETLAEVFPWMKLSEMKDKLIPWEESWIEETSKHYKSRIGVLMENKEWLKALEISSMTKFFFTGMPQGSAFIDMESNLLKRKEVIQAMQLQENWLQQEQLIQQQYLGYLQTKDLNWWTIEVNRLQQLISQRKGTEEAHVYKRVLSYMSLVCYMNAMQVIKTGPQGTFRYIVTLYGLVDPENAETAYLLAIADIRENQTGKALQSLNKAISLGFNDSNRLENDSNFLNLHSMQGFADVLKKMKQ